MSRRGRAGRRRRDWVSCCVLSSLLLAGCTSVGTAQDPPETAYRPLPSAVDYPARAPEEGSSPFGAHWDPSRISAFSAYLEGMHGTATYYEATWCRMEPAEGLFRWRSLDRAIRTAQRFGITLFVKIRTGTCWATVGEAQYVRGHAGKTESSMPRSLARYRSFVRTLVRRAAAGGVREFAVENEVNSPSYWAGTVGQYVRLVEVAARTIREAAPAALVVDAGLSSTCYGYGVADRLLQAGHPEEAVRAYATYFARRVGTRGEQLPAVSDDAELRAVLDSEQGRRNLAYLRATEQLLREGTVDVRQVHFYEWWTAVPALLDYVHATTPTGVPVEAWEVGSFWVGASGDDAERADEMLRTLALLVAGGVRRALWLPLAVHADNWRGEEVRYGLLDPDGRLRATGAAAKLLVALSRGAAVHAVHRGGLDGVAFRTAGRTALVVWSSDENEVPVRLGPGARAASPGTALRPIGEVAVVGTTPRLLVTSLPLARTAG